jgi:hypothetical protein
VRLDSLPGKGNMTNVKFHIARPFISTKTAPLATGFISEPIKTALPITKGIELSNSCISDFETPFTQKISFELQKLQKKQQELSSKKTAQVDNKIIKKKLSNIEQDRRRLSFYVEQMYKSLQTIATNLR